MKKLFQTTSLVSVLNVSDLTEALAWYGAWLGKPDETPQLDATAETVKPSAAIIGVDDLAACRTALLETGIAVGEIQDWEVVLSCDLHDPDGNKISLAQIISQQ